MTALLSEVFSADGPLAAGVPGYRLRSQQLELAERIAAAMADNRVLVAEAGTGTGKTYAYLVPALLAGGKVIVSTGTRNLQDQLFTRDIPTIRQALKSPVKVALLKGRANYLCHYHLARSLADGRFLSRDDASHAQRIARFARKTRSGDKAECADVPENATVWTMVTSTRDNCLGQDCPNHKECFVLAARREALAADLVVVNHHLFFADVMLRDEGTAELLPACNTVIFDEAHQLPEVASLFFGDSVSTAQLLELARDAQLEGVASARDCLDLPRLCRVLEKAVRDLRLALPVDPARYALVQLEALPGFASALAAVIADLEALASLLETQAQRAEGLENCWRRATRLVDPPAVLAERGQCRLRPLGRDLYARAAAQCHAAGDCRDHAEADERTPAGLDIHFGNPRRAERFCALLPRDGTGRRLLGALGESLRLPAAGPAVRAAESARPEQCRLYRGGGQGGVARAQGERWQGFLSVYFPACDASNARAAQRVAAT
jgi:ATP-dependent DNA helicase DinG